MILADLYSGHRIKLAINLPIIQTKMHNQKPRKKIKNRQASKKNKRIKNH
jgi:hypothetical protein